MCQSKYSNPPTKQVRAAMEEGKPLLKMCGMQPTWKKADNTGTRKSTTSDLRLFSHTVPPTQILCNFNFTNISEFH